MAQHGTAWNRVLSQRGITIHEGAVCVCGGPTELIYQTVTVHGEGEIKAKTSYVHLSGQQSP